MCTERIINSKPKKIGHVYRERIRPAYNTPIYGAGIMPRKKTGKAQGYRVHRSTHPQGQGEQGAGRTHTPQPQHYADTQQAGQVRHRAHHRTGGTAPHRSTAHRRKHKRVHKSTSRCAIVVAWSTRGQTTRSYPTTPLAPLREDMAQGIRACAVSSFACRRGTASP